MREGWREGEHPSEAGKPASYYIFQFVIIASKSGSEYARCTAYAQDHIDGFCLA